MTPSKDTHKELDRIVYKKIKYLKLDPYNPRFSLGNGTGSQMELLKTLWTEMAIDELILSIAANGFFHEEPLFVIPDPPGQDPDNPETEFVVIEGNRRLAAVQILVNDEIRQAIRATDMPVISEEQKNELRQLPVSIYKNRKDLWSYLGFRHINSPKEWDAFSKAKYVAHVHEDYGVPIDEIARKIGDNHSTVVRLYRGYKIYKQAEKLGVFSIDDQVRNKFYFSHLYTAMAYPEFQDFLGINETSSLKEDPVSPAFKDNLQQLMTWLYGSKSKGLMPIIRKQNPDLNHLRDVIGQPESLNALVSGFSLERSYEISVGDTKRFREALTISKENLIQAKGTVTIGYNGENDLISTIDDILEIGKTVQTEMKAKHRKTNRGK